MVESPLIRPSGTFSHEGRRKGKSTSIAVCPAPSAALRYSLLATRYSPFASTGTPMRLSPTLAVIAAFIATPASAACLDDIRTALALSMTSGPYRFTTAISAEAMTMSVVGSVIPPNAMHSTTELGGTTQEIIVVGDEGWMNTAESGWVVMPPDLTQTLQAAIEGLSASLWLDLENPQCLGAQTVEGSAYLAYGFEYTVGGATSVTTVYADPASGRPLRMQALATADGKTTTVTTRYAYDPAIVIALPPAN